VAHINGLSEAFLERYLAQRRAGRFESLEDFIERCRPGEAEGQMLLDAGALDGFGACRPELFWQLRAMLRRKGDAALFAGAERGRRALGRGIQEKSIALSSPDARQMARRERELLGFPVTLDPLTYLGGDDQGRNIDWSRYTPVARLHQCLGRRVHVCGLMVADRISGTLGGGLMKFVTLSDRTGFVETILFPDVYRRFGHLTAAHPILAATGIVEPFETGQGFTLRVQSVRPPARSGEAGGKVAR
jgi:DNA polymerase-3 subunit alpha/error-prone DNA polymerase